MDATNSSPNEGSQVVRHLFEEASRALTKAISLNDAEPEMARFLHHAKAHPEERKFIFELFVHALSQRDEPWEFVQFCAHGLRWIELAEHFERKRSEATHVDDKHFWKGMCDAFDDNWEDAEFYREFQKGPASPKRSGH